MKCGWTFLGDQDQSVLLEVGQAPEIVRVVPPHFHHAEPFALPFKAMHQVGPSCFHPVGNCGGGQVLSRREEVLDLIEDPGVSNAPSANHDAVDAIFIAVSKRLFWGVDVAIAKDGNVHVGVLLTARINDQSASPLYI